jgi:hypothetical protein
VRKGRGVVGLLTFHMEGALHCPTANHRRPPLTAPVPDLDYIIPYIPNTCQDFFRLSFYEIKAFTQTRIINAIKLWKGDK